MKTALEERIKKKLLQFGRKNRICGALVMPALVICMFCFHTLRYCRGNSKRFSMIALTFCLFVVYSSFSFPLFISGNDRGAEWSQTDLDSDVELAAESEINLEEVELLSDEDVLEEDELTDSGNPHGMDGMVKYNADDILASLEMSDSIKSETAREQTERTESGELSFDRDDWRLVLINKQHSIPDDYSFTLGSISGGKLCDERILEDLWDMLQDAKKDGINLQVCSPYRTPEHQVELFEKKMTRYMNRGMSYMEAYQLSSQIVTVPGNSEHEVGLALDIVRDIDSDLLQSFADTEAGKWLAENSCNYGFILRYPKGKEYVTGIEFEPWHFRYVGVDAATLITEEGITLEEFWEEYL